MIMTNVTFPQLIQRGCGIDVHLKVVVATIDGVGIQKETRSFNTFTSCLTEMKEWLLANGITHVAMESTGVYWKPVMRVLEEAIPNVWIVNDRHIKNVPGHKTDKMDSEWICKLLLAGLVKPSYIPPKEQRQLRDLTRYRNKLIQTIAAEKNRMMRVLEDCNIKLSSVVANTSGVTATALIDMLCEGRKLTMADIESVYHKKLSASPQELLEACSGFVEDHHVYMLQMIRKSIAQTQGLIDELSKRIKDILVKYDNVLELLKSGFINTGHAKVILSLPTPELQEQAAQIIADNQLNVRQAEALCKKLAKPAKEPREPQPRGTLPVEVEESLKQVLGSEVNVAYHDGKGKLTVHFYSDEQLRAFANLLGQYQNEE